MAATTVTNNADASALLSATAASAGITGLDSLNDLGRLATIVANIINGGGTLPTVTATTGAITTVNATTATAATLRGSTSVGIGAAAGGASSGIRIVKAVTAIADNTFTDVFTVTVPNAAHAGTIKVTFQGVKGAGDAEGAAGSVSSTDYNISIQRTAGATTTAATSAALGTIATTIAAGNAVLTTAQCSAMTGAVGATQTFTVQVKIARAAGASTNHTCFAVAELLNSFGTGITIA